MATKKGRMVWLHFSPGCGYGMSLNKNDGVQYHIQDAVMKASGFKMKSGECRRVRIKIEEVK